MAPRAKKTAEQKNVETIEKMQAQLTRALDENRLTQTRLAEEKASLDAALRQSEVEPALFTKRRTRESTKGAKELLSQQKMVSKPHQVSVDLGAGLVAQVSTETLNALVRASADWMPEGWIANNVDILQGAPQLIAGAGIYLIELVSRKKDALPTTPREWVSEASKVFAQLGLSNLVRAWRVRSSDGKQVRIDFEALQKEKAVLEQRLAALQAAKPK